MLRRPQKSELSPQKILGFSDNDSFVLVPVEVATSLLRGNRCSEFIWICSAINFNPEEQTPVRFRNQIVNTFFGSNYFSGFLSKIISTPQTRREVFSNVISNVMKWLLGNNYNSTILLRSHTGLRCCRMIDAVGAAANADHLLRNASGEWVSERPAPHVVRWSGSRTRFCLLNIN